MKNQSTIKLVVEEKNAAEEVIAMLKHIFSGHFPRHDYHDMGPTRIVHLYLSL